MSLQKITETEVPAATKFPNAWLAPAMGKHVIERVHWNTEADPGEKAYLSVKWDKFHGRRSLLTTTSWGIEIAGLLLHLYFGIEGCIIPVACIPELDENLFVFTLAGPCDPTTGKKDFYVMFHTWSLEGTYLRLLSHGFSSVSEFYQNSFTLELKFVAPVEGGKEVMMARYVELGIYDD
ncbi:hypothetical protein C8J57DRAFT_1236260 [Mycena rebaudengoi]|nr:hypothetical protein C8J57DRAFT_1236260 [Mycena rebaudengoi]